MPPHSELDKATLSDSESTANKSIHLKSLLWIVVPLVALVILFGPRFVNQELPVFRDAGHFYYPLLKYEHEQWTQPVPIAAGEVLTRRQAFMPWIESHAIDIIQPDVTKCGGLTEALRIARMAEDHHVKMVSHGWNTAVGLAADLQLAAAMPNAHYVEYLTPAAYIEDIVVDKFEIDEEGFLQIPQVPGLGIELDRDALARFSGE